MADFVCRNNSRSTQEMPRGDVTRRQAGRRQPEAASYLLEHLHNTVTLPGNEHGARFEVSKCNCRCWFCPECCLSEGYKLRGRLIPILESFHGLIMVTLTVDPELFPDPKTAYLYMLDKRCIGVTTQDLFRWNHLITRRFFCVVEWQKKTEQAHFHILYDSTFIPWDTLLACMLTDIMFSHTLTDNADTCPVSEASRAGISRRREFGSELAIKAAMKREPRRHSGINPNSRLNRRKPSPSTSSHLQVREVTMSESVYVGIDIAKDTFCVATCPNVFKTTLPNTPQGHRKLCKSLHQHTIEKIVLEATGGYERPLTAELLNAELPVVVVNPRQVRDFAKGMGQRAKTDPIDAQVLAQFAQIVKPKPKTHATAKTIELTELVRRRRQLNDLRTKETNRVKMIHHPKVEKSIKKMIKTIDCQIKEIDQLIREYIESDDDFKNKDRILQSVPGVGPQTSAMLIANLPELGILNRQEIAALAGLAPWNRSSGKFTGKMHIWGGRKDVRSVLYMAAFTACRSNPVIQKLAQRLKENGKAYKVILTACMRKLLVILNTMIRNQTIWTPKK